MRLGWKSRLRGSDFLLGRKEGIIKKKSSRFFFPDDFFINEQMRVIPQLQYDHHVGSCVHWHRTKLVPVYFSTHLCSRPLRKTLCILFLVACFVVFPLYPCINC